ncbi:hypothetical protein KSP39_PZI023769 [Platanthera zijinensis]|uniref:Uncharacterized protein n=1 Tax=Platanthera zijinensis TaxID=2320716 RepID=A0AAP0ASN5_9ASPA
MWSEWNKNMRMLGTKLNRAWYCEKLGRCGEDLASYQLKLARAVRPEAEQNDEQGNKLGHARRSLSWSTVGFSFSLCWRHRFLQEKVMQYRYRSHTSN